MELRGYPYLSFVGNEGFFANARAALPDHRRHEDADRHPGPGARARSTPGIGGAQLPGRATSSFGTSEPGVSYVSDPVFGEPVSGFHLVDGRASYGVGLQFFFLGYPLHFDWSKLTDLKVHSPCRFDFWIGFDF